MVVTQKYDIDMVLGKYWFQHVPQIDARAMRFRRRIKRVVKIADLPVSISRAF
jgi:hypothetical protein